MTKRKRKQKEMFKDRERNKDGKKVLLKGSVNNREDANKTAPFICSAHRKTPLLFNPVFLPKRHINFVRGLG